MLVKPRKTFAGASGKSLVRSLRATAMRDSKASTRRLIAPSSKRDGSGSDHTVFLNHLGGRDQSGI